MQNDDFSAMAKRFLDAWQAQFAASFQDPEHLQRNLQMMQNYARSVFEHMQPRKENDRASGVTSAHVSAGSDELSRVFERLAALERRVSRLETSPGADRRPTANTRTRAEKSS